MSGVKISLDARLLVGRAAEFQRQIEQRIERAALTATRRAALVAKERLRTEMAGAGLGRLGQAIGETSDQKEGKGVHRRADGSFSASGVLFVRSKSERTLGALEAYTKGADIRPVRSRWLWIPTDDIPRLGAGRKRLTPGTWKSSGMEAKVGPLVYVKAVNGYPLLVVKNTNVPLSGRRGRPRASLKNGRAPKGYGEKQFLVAFVGIPHTARAARVDVRQVLRSVQAELPQMFNQAFGVR